MEGKSEYLEGLLEATKELSHIDRSNIFYHLMVTYCKADETDKALGLWTLLQEEGEIPSDDFLLHLGNHLKSKNRDIPFVIPEINVKSESVQKSTVTSKEQPKSTKNDLSTQVEDLIKDGKAKQAADLTLKNLELGAIPRASVLKFLLKSLAEEGNFESIESIGKYLTETMKKNVAYDNKLTQAIFLKGNGAQHLDNILNLLQNKGEDEIENILQKFPRSAVLASAVQNSELNAKCQKAVELAASKGFTLPANLLWMEYILLGNDKEANSIWQKYLANANVVIFRRLLQESHIRKEPQIIEKLIDNLKSNKNIPLASIGNAYSRLINFYILENKIDEAKAALNRAFESGVTKEHINQSSIKKLQDVTGMKFD